MKPYPVTFYVYAEDDAEVQDLRCALYDLVTSYYNEGILISANKLNQILKNFSRNPILKQFMK